MGTLPGPDRGSLEAATLTEMIEALDGMPLPARRPATVSREIVPFDPLTSRRCFRLGLSYDCVGAVFAPMMGMLREEAPYCDLALQEGTGATLEALLRAGEITTLLAPIAEDPAPGITRRRLGASPWVTLRDAATPPIERLDAYCARPHAIISVCAYASIAVDRLLAAQGRERQVLLSMPALAMLPAALRDTDMIATVPLHAVARLVAGGGLVCDEPPLELPPLAVAISWMADAPVDPAETWLRSRLERCARAMMAAG